MNKAVFRDGVVYHADFREVLPELEGVNLIVMDVPYGCGYKTNQRRISATPPPLVNDDKPRLDFVKPLVEVVQPNSAIYLCTRFSVYSQWEQALKDAGAAVKTTIVWDKGNWTSGDLSGDYGNQVELILYAHVGRSLLRQGRPSNLWAIPREGAGLHPTPKPVELFRRCIVNSSDPGDVVFDPFLGSGTTAVACILTDRKFVACEIDATYFDLSCRRIEKTYREIDYWLPGFNLYPL